MAGLNNSKNSKPRIVSLRDLDKNEDYSSDDEKQTYYTGGEKSGTAVQGNGPNSGAGNVLKNIFAKASAQQNERFPDEKDTNVVAVHLIFWSDGLTVNDGPLRPFNDPATLHFLDQIRREIIPDELDIDPNSAVDFKMTQIPDKSYDHAKQLEILKKDESTAKKKHPFSGNPETTGDAHNEVISVNVEAEIADNIVTTRIQVVLPNGMKKVITINPRASISELYSHIQQETKVSDFTLIYGTPPLSVPKDLDACLFQVGLLNCSVIIKQ